MNKTRIEITSENKKLINGLFIQTNLDNVTFIDNANPYGGGNIYDDVALLLGYVKIDELNDSADEPYSNEIEEKIVNTHNSLRPNETYEDLLSLIIQFSTKGGLENGVYECITRTKIWKKL